MTFQQLRTAIASVLRTELQCDTPSAVQRRVEQRLRRNQLARLYHWQRHHRLPPKNLDRKRF